MDAKLHYCLPGYALSSSKTFLIAFDEATSFAEVKFKILDASSKCVFEDAAKKICRCDYTGEFLFRGDFSAVTAPGNLTEKPARSADDFPRSYTAFPL